MLAAFRAEMSKQWRRPRTYVALGLVAAIPVLITVVLKLNPPTGGGEHDDAFFFLALRSGLLLPAAALRLMSRFLLVVVVALFAGDAISSEASWGNLRALLVRPIRRERLLAAKLASVGLFGFLATAVVVLVGLLAGVIAFGFHPLVLPLIGTQSEGALLGHLALATVYVTWSLMSVAALSFMISTMTDSPAGAVLAGVGLYLVSQILDAISSLGSVRYGLPTHYFDNWVDLFRGSGWTADMTRGALLPIPYVLVFCGVGFWWFRRKDVLS